MLATSSVVKPRLHDVLRLVAAFSLLFSTAHSFEVDASEWWTPAANFAKVYDFGGEDDCEIKSPVSPARAAQAIGRVVSQAIPFQAQPLMEFPLSLLGLGTERTRENGTKHKAAGHSAVEQAKAAVAPTASPAKATANSSLAAKVKLASAAGAAAPAAVQAHAKVAAPTVAQAHATAAAPGAVQAHPAAAAPASVQAHPTAAAPAVVAAPTAVQAHATAAAPAAVQAHPAKAAPAAVQANATPAAPAAVAAVQAHAAAAAPAAVQANATPAAPAAVQAHAAAAAPTAVPVHATPAAPAAVQAHAVAAAPVAVHANATPAAPAAPAAPASVQAHAAATAPAAVQANATPTASAAAQAHAAAAAPTAAQAHATAARLSAVQVHATPAAPAAVLAHAPAAAAAAVQIKATPAAPAAVQVQVVTVKLNATATGSAKAAANNTKVEAKAEVKAAAATETKKQIPQVVKKTWLEWLRMTMSFAFVIKALCMGSNLVFQASPLPVIKEFNEKGHTGEADSAPFISIAYGSCQWCFYGLFAFFVTAKQGFLVLVYSNVCGTFLGMFYVYQFISHCNNAEVWLRSKVYFQVLSVVAFSQVIAMCAMPPVKALFFCGIISSAWSVVGATSMLTTVPTVLKTKSSKSLPLPLLLAAGISAVLWITCGVMLRDPWITVPNVCCFCCTGFALSLCWIYPRTGGEECQEEDEEEAAPLLHEEDEPSDGRQVLSDRQSPLVSLMRSLRGNGDGTPTREASGHGISAGTGETWD